MVGADPDRNINRRDSELIDALDLPEISEERAVWASTAPPLAAPLPGNAERLVIHLDLTRALGRVPGTDDIF